MHVVVIHALFYRVKYRIIIFLDSDPL